MTMKSIYLSAVTLLLATVAYAKVPSTTDEARAVARAVPASLPVRAPSVITSTDEARTASKHPAAELPGAIPRSRPVSSTDEARAVSAGVTEKYHGAGG